MAMNNGGNSYQVGTTAAASNARRILAVIAPQVQGGFNFAASYTTTLGSNADLTYTAVNGGSAGNSVTVAYVVSGNNTPLTVSVTGNAITVNVATGAGGAATSTASQVMAAVNASTPASALVTAALAVGSSGAGIVSAMTAKSLAGGTDFVQGGISNAPLPTIPPIHYRYA